MVQGNTNQSRFMFITHLLSFAKEITRITIKQFFAYFLQFFQKKERKEKLFSLNSQPWPLAIDQVRQKFVFCMKNYGKNNLFFPRRTYFQLENKSTISSRYTFIKLYHAFSDFIFLNLHFFLLYFTPILYDLFIGQSMKILNWVSSFLQK